MKWGGNGNTLSLSLLSLQVEAELPSPGQPLSSRLQELASKLGSGGGGGSMPHLELCMKEVMRLTAHTIGGIRKVRWAS